MINNSVDDLIKSDFLKDYAESTELISNIIQYLTLDFPILFSYESDYEIFLAYVLGYDDFNDNFDVIITPIDNYNTLYELAKSELGIFEIFDRMDIEYKSKCIYLHYRKKNQCKLVDVSLADKVERLIGLEDYHNDDYLVEDILPEEGFIITPNMINRVNLNLIKYELEDKVKHPKIKLKNNKSTNKYLNNKMNLMQYGEEEKIKYPKIKLINNKSTTEYWNKEIISTYGVEINSLYSDDKAYDKLSKVGIRYF